MKVGFVSLGCSKNLVDTEMMIGLFKKQNYIIVNNPEESEIIVINTCGFINSAKEEAINTILEMAKYKEKNCKLLFVTGCLVKRYKEELEKQIPEVDVFISIDQYENIWEIISKKVEEKLGKQEKYKEAISNCNLDYMQREISTGNNTAYLKIAEGCSNYCTYCAIPYIRGKYISREMEDILEEAKMLARKGIKEVIVIAQDTTKYGMDIYGKSMLADLLDKLTNIKEFHFIRFLYAYPESITDELIEVVKRNDKICNYFDIPIQHISNEILKRMNRKTTREDIIRIIQSIRKRIPDAIIRTSLIVGFPGETQEDFELLYDFVKEAKFDKLGVFEYSKEENTPASLLKNQIHHSTKKSRYNKIMFLQKQIVEEKMQKKIGNTCDVLIESTTKDKKYYIGRTYMDVPDMDGVVYIENTKDYMTNKISKCKISGILEYDFIGKFI